MVKIAQPGSGHDSGLKARTPFDGSFGRGVLVQANVSSVLMVVGKVVTPKPPKMRFVQGNNVVEQFATRTTDPALRHSVLPGAANARVPWLESTGC
jgi:hypothetical protein